MTPRQRDLISKYLSDLSKGVLIAALIGVGAGKLRWWIVLRDVVGAALALLVAYRLEGWANGTTE